jgi:hypothetical protein
VLDRLTPVVLFVFLLVSYSLKISAQAPSAGIYAKLSESSSLLADTVSEAFTTGNNVLDIIVLTRPDLGKRPICYAGQLNESDQVANALFESIQNRRLEFTDGEWLELYYLPYAASSWGGVTFYCIRGDSVFLAGGEYQIRFQAGQQKGALVEFITPKVSDVKVLEIASSDLACLYQRCGKPLPRRIAFIGNSITFHPPKASVGWHGRWGMAASAKENDYVHRITLALGAEAMATYASGDWERNITTFRLKDFKNNETRLRDFDTFSADLVVMNIGENIGSNAYAVDQLVDEILALIQEIRAVSGAEIILVDSFYQQQNVNRAVLLAAIQAQVRWVGMRPLAGVAEYRAHQFFENNSVGSHPSDAGMDKIAALILEVIYGGDI